MNTKKFTRLIVKTLNKWLRTPQRVSSTQLTTKTVIIQETYKNKQILNVYANINPRYLAKI